MLPNEVNDIDQPLYDWGIENRMEQYYNAQPPQSNFPNLEETAHEVLNYKFSMQKLVQCNLLK